MDIKAKFTWSFAAIVVLVSGMTTFIVNSVGKTADAFHT